jgi:hypothetical protein
MSDEAVSKELAATKEASEKTRAEAQARLKGKPTPTQEENDRAKLGEHIPTHEADGSDPDPNNMAQTKLGETKHMEAQSSGAGYQTRQGAAATHREGQHRARADV